ncbi:MAG: HD domain-containing protein [Spirochaetaceae bacterium]|jgi:poly(A) polymerase|nr:HD domain-containing protein [Spirochaetaceae bacterium]
MNNSAADSGYILRLAGFSALDSYLGLKPLPCLCIETDADPGALARLFETLRYPGASLADAAHELPSRELPSKERRTLYFRCVEKNSPSSLGGFYQDWEGGHFHDPQGIYPLLRTLKGPDTPQAPENLFRHLFFKRPVGGPAGGDTRTDFWETSFSMALFFARYCPETGPDIQTLMEEAVTILESRREFSSLPPPPLAETQRIFLDALLLSSQSGQGLRFLKQTGLLETLWPELDELEKAGHSKEYHPEGNAWEHTLETLRYRKKDDLTLSLGLLLHDIGKPLSASSGNRRFDGHAELGARIAAKFLSRLDYDNQTIDNIIFLVKNHMLPAALPRLPLFRTREILESPLFPVLMELYRCDESSSFKGLDNYYKSSAAYRAYLKTRRNPYLLHN